jgi:serine/threonine-protein kinase
MSEGPELEGLLRAAFGGTYLIEHELGGGGMSRVFVAEEVALGRSVVIKVLPPELAAGVDAERFRREVRLAARLQHPHIVPLLAAGEVGELLYYTMPYVAGESLRDRLRRECRLPVDEALRLARDVADALHYAHGEGVVHRDVKPGNILLSGDHALVTDFGIAQALSRGEASGVGEDAPAGFLTENGEAGRGTSEGRLTAAGLMVGTPQYMSPEQASGGEVDARSDVYSLGCVLYEMLAGGPPHLGATTRTDLLRLLREPPPPLRGSRPDAPEPVERAIAQALAPAPEVRFQSAAEFAHALGQPPPAEDAAAAAPPASARRHLPWLRAAVPLLVLCLALAGGLLMRGRSGERNARDRAMLAVLPLKNLGAPADQYFADGLTEEITSRLASVGALGVISRTSAEQYRDTRKPLKEVGHELGVGYILEGSVRWEKTPGGQGRIRVTPQLIRVADDRHLWAGRYEAEFADVFRVQGDIAGQVATALGVALRAPEHRALKAPETENLDAYALYLQGRQALRLSPSEEAVRLFERAVALDSTFAAAYVGLAEAHQMIYGWAVDRSGTRMARVEAALDQTLRLQPDLVEALQAQGRYYAETLGDYGRALRVLSRGQSAAQRRRHTPEPRLVDRSESRQAAGGPSALSADRSARSPLRLEPSPPWPTPHLDAPVRGGRGALGRGGGPRARRLVRMAVEGVRGAAAG